MTCIFESFHHLTGCRISFSFRCVRKSSIPLLFVSRTQKCPVSSRESLRVLLDFFWIRNTNSIISFLSPIDVVEHWHEDDPTCEYFRLDVLFSQVTLDLLKNLQWRKSWENIPLEFNCFSSNSLRGHFEFFHLTFPSCNCIFAFVHLSQAQYGVWADRYSCFCPLNHLIMRQYWSLPWGRCPVNRIHLQNFFRMLQYQYLSDIE